MKTALLSLFLFSLLWLGISAQNCTTDADCKTGTLNSCCYNPYFAKGSCYDSSVDVCTTCYCQGGGCAAMENKLCAIADFSADAECCVDKCVNPNTDECCSYHLPHSSQGTSNVCPLSETGACCGANCYDTETEQCCIYQTGDTQYYVTGKDRVCCGFYGSCDAATQYCNGSTPNYNGQCVNKTNNDNSATTTTTQMNYETSATANPQQPSGSACSSQACCDAMATPNYQTGAGFYKYNADCTQGGLHCIGNTGCQLCFRGTSDNNNQANEGNRPACGF